MSLERPNSRASSWGRGPPPAPPPTYLWEELRRSRSRGGYPWTILDKEPLPDHLDAELLLKGEIPVEYVRGRSSEKKSQHIRNRLRDREHFRRARSEPTPSIPSISTVSLIPRDMDQAMAADPSFESNEVDDFPLPDEEIPDFVMAYLQSDKGNLDEDIPDHILEYIQSRAAILEKSQAHLKQLTDDDLFYTEDELRILDEARRRLEEQGELSPPSVQQVEEGGGDHFDQFFQRAADDDVVLPVPVSAPAEPPSSKGARSKNKKSASSSGGGKFNFKGLSMPSKPQLNIKLPRFRQEKKSARQNVTDDQGDAAEAPRTTKKQRRPKSASPMGQRINQQLESWNNSLQRLKARGRQRKDEQIKSFVALLPGRSKSRPKETENQYEEVGRPREERKQPIVTITAPDQLEVASYERPDASEETMDEVDNLPESEVADAVGATGMSVVPVVDSEVIDMIPPRGEFVDIDIDDDFSSDPEEPPPETEEQAGTEEPPPQAVDTTPTEPTGLAARGRKVFQDTKSKIQNSWSKEPFQTTRNKLQSTLSKKNFTATGRKVQMTTQQGLQATRDKLQSTLSRKNLQKTRDKLQTTLGGTLKKMKKPDPLPPVDTNIFLDEGGERNYETSTPIFLKMSPKASPANENESVVKPSTPTLEPPSPPSVTKRTKKGGRKAAASKSLTSLSRDQEWEDIEEETEEDVEEELELRMEFSLRGLEKPPTSSVSQSTETLPEDGVDSDKENVVVRPKRQRYRHHRHGFHEGLGRPRSAHYEPDTVRSSWHESLGPTYPVLPPEVLAAFSTPVNSLDAVHSGWGSAPRKPDRPSRAKKVVEDVYAVPPRRKHRTQAYSNSTWPRKEAAIIETDRPTVPKRLKPASRTASKQAIMTPLGADSQTWPRRSGVKGPPAAPRRTRSDSKKSELKLDFIQSVESQIENLQNILTDADTLFGPESRFIDEESSSTSGPKRIQLRAQKNDPMDNILADGDTLFGAESRFIDDDLSLSDRAPKPQQRKSTKNKVLVEHQLDNAPPVLNNLSETSPTGSQQKILNHQPIIGATTLPAAPKRLRNRTASNRIQLSQNYQDATWPRMSRHLPSPPHRPKRSSTTKKNKGFLEPEKPVKKLPAVPSSTPEGCGANGLHQPEGHADIDQILEILATFPTRDASSPPREEVATASDQPTSTVIAESSATAEDENPYAEIKHFQKKAAPPRPPPPATYAAPSTTSTSASYAYIYTAPRRKQKGASAPERPPRTYCTIRPHRPPRNRPSRTKETHSKPVEEAASTPSSVTTVAAAMVDVSTAVQRHSFAAEETVAKEEARDLQAENVVERMRARPLPAPPRSKRIRSRSPPQRPPRSRTNSKSRNQSEERSDAPQLEVEVVTPVTEVAPSPESAAATSAITAVSSVERSSIADTGYEPIESPRVEEVSVGIQTDPISPEYEESVHAADVVVGDRLTEEVTDSQTAPFVGTEETANVPIGPPVPPASVCLEPVSPSEPPAGEVIWSAETSPDDPEPVFSSQVCPSEEAEPGKCNAQQTRQPEHDKPDSKSRVVTTAADDGDEDSFAHMPTSFFRGPLPPVRLDFPTRLQLAELDVERLNVREVTAERIVVSSSVDTNILQVSQTTSTSGQLVFNIGPGVTIPSLEGVTMLMPAPVTVAASPPVAPPSALLPPAVAVENKESQTVEDSQVAAEAPAPTEEKMQTTQEQPAASSTPEDLAPTPAPSVRLKQPMRKQQSCPVTPQGISPTPGSAEVGRAELYERPPQTVDAVRNEQRAPAQPRLATEEPSVSDLTVQLVSLSSRNLARGACAAVAETYSVARKVAQLGLQQVNEQLRRRGVIFDEKDQENLKAICLVLLFMIAGIFLLGLGKNRLSTHWDFYFPN